LTDLLTLIDHCQNAHNAQQSPLMARLYDLPVVLWRVGPIAFAKRVWSEVNEDNLLVWASALAYAWLFAVFPFFIFLLTLLPYLPQRVKTGAMDSLHNAMIQVLPGDAATTVRNNVDDIMRRRHNGLLSFGIILTLWAASGGMNMTLRAMDRCYDLPRGRPLYKERSLAILMTMITAALIVLLMVLLPVGSVVIHWIEAQHIKGISEGTLWLWNVARYLTALGLMFSLVAVVYHFGPSIRQDFRILTPGAVFTVGIWLLLEYLFRFYITRFGRYDQTYGTVGGVAILLLFFYIDAFVLLVGAEINSEIDFARGFPRGSDDFRKSAVAALKEPESSEDDDDDTPANPQT